MVGGSGKSASIGYAIDLPIADNIIDPLQTLEKHLCVYHKYHTEVIDKVEYQSVTVVSIRRRGEPLSLGLSSKIRADTEGSTMQEI